LRAAGTVAGMTQQHESRWSLAHTGNRVLLAVVAGLLLSALCGGAGLTGAARVVVFLAVAGVAYVLATVLHRTRR
jgi:hypothetical protein